MRAFLRPAIVAGGRARMLRGTIALSQQQCRGYREYNSIDCLMDASDAWHQLLPNRKLGDESELRDAFDRIDTDRNGFISVAELRMALISQNGMPAPGFSEAIVDAQVQNMVKFADVDQDGRVSYAEYKRVIQAGCDPSGGRDHIRRHSGQAARIMSQQVTADESVIHL